MANERNPYEFDESAVFVAPPEEFPDDIEPPEWPKWVGGIGLAVGGLGTCCSLMGAASTALAPRLMQMAAAGQQMDLPPVMTSPPLATRLSVAAQVVTSLLLVVAAALCLARKPASRTLHLVWAVLAIAVFLWATYVGLQVQAQIDQWVRDNPDAEFAELMRSGAGMQGAMTQMISIGINTLLSLAWPIFCLIWFGLIKRRARDFGPPPSNI